MTAAAAFPIESRYLGTARGGFRGHREKLVEAAEWPGRQCVHERALISNPLTLLRAHRHRLLPPLPPPPPPAAAAAGPGPARKKQTY